MAFFSRRSFLHQPAQFEFAHTRDVETHKNQTIAVSELQHSVIDHVQKLTEDGQNQTVRRGNLEYDVAGY
jgi:hypothetical protein